MDAALEALAGIVRATRLKGDHQMAIEEGVFVGRASRKGTGGKHAQHIADACQLKKGEGWVKVTFDVDDPKEPLRTQTALRGKLREIYGKVEDGNDFKVEVQGNRESGILGIYRPKD